MKTIIHGKIVYLAPWHVEAMPNERVVIHSWREMTPEEIQLYEKKDMNNMSANDLIQGIAGAVFGNENLKKLK